MPIGDPNVTGKITFDSGFGGATCAKCGTWVPKGNWHDCQSGQGTWVPGTFPPSPSPPQPPPILPMQPLFLDERIVKALEKIAECLERLVEWEVPR